jgi:hypothetical protein
MMRNSKFKIPNSKEESGSKCDLTWHAHLEFGAWNFFGVWSLEFGILT